MNAHPLLADFVQFHAEISQMKRENVIESQWYVYVCVTDY